MFHLLTPNLRVESVLELTVDRLQKLGINGLLLDVDCTLKRYPEKDVQPRDCCMAGGLKSRRDWLLHCFEWLE